MNAKNFFYEFGKAIYHVDSVYDDFAKEGKVATALLWVLYALNDGKAHTQIEISKDWELPKTTVNTVIKELQQNSYVELEPIKGKRREMTIILTKSGKEYADRILKDLYAKEEAVFQKLTKEEINVIEKLERIVSLLREEEV